MFCFVSVFVHHTIQGSAYHLVTKSKEIANTSIACWFANWPLYTEGKKGLKNEAGYSGGLLKTHLE